jgi:hypothetical protein
MKVTQRLRQWGLITAINLVAVVVAVLAFGAWKRYESAQAPINPMRSEGSYAAGFFDQHIDDVGFIAKAGRHVTSRKLLGDRVIYDAVYTTGPDHFRVVPNANEKPDRCVLLFGDSFTFGEGVNDDETSAAQIVKKSEGRVAAKNLGISGWGPHQFLAGLQSGRFQRAITCTPTDAFYLMIPTHIARAAGRGVWDAHGPLFLLGADGRPVRHGNFDTDMGLGWRQLVGLNRLTDGEEADLTAAILVEGARELKARYPGIHFRVLLWAIDREFSLEILERALRGMARGGVEVHSMEEVIPHLAESWPQYVIPLEGHPNPRADERIADFIIRSVDRGEH